MGSADATGVVVLAKAAVTPDKRDRRGVAYGRSGGASEKVASQSMALDFAGVFPAITTPFTDGGAVDHAFLAKHAQWMLDAGCHGLIPCGSLGEAGTLAADEKIDVVKTCVSTGAPVIPGVSALSTAEAVNFIQAAEAAGAEGFMILPPYAYSTDWREMKAHMKTCFQATSKPCILYNNPIAYKTDFLPVHIAEIAAECPNMTAVKESSADVRRLAAIRAEVGDNLTLMVGVDDLIVEGCRNGSTGWVAGLVNAFPVESVRLWRWALEGHPGTDELYRWFLPLLRLDVVPKFVQLIKLTQQEVGWGSESVRAPRLLIEGAEREAALAVIRKGIAERPA